MITSYKLNGYISSLFFFICLFNIYHYSFFFFHPVTYLFSQFTHSNYTSQLIAEEIFQVFFTYSDRYCSRISNIGDIGIISFDYTDQGTTTTFVFFANTIQILKFDLWLWEGFLRAVLHCFSPLSVFEKNDVGY